MNLPQPRDPPVSPLAAKAHQSAPPSKAVVAPRGGVWHVEVCLKPTSSLSVTSGVQMSRAFLAQMADTLDSLRPLPAPGHSCRLQADFPEGSDIQRHVAFMDIVQDTVGPQGVNGLDPVGVCPVWATLNWATDPRIRVHVFKLDVHGSQTEDIDEEGTVHAALSWILPSSDIDGQWESLVFDSNIKSALLDYVQMAMLLSERGVDPNRVSWNRVVFLHGPPGTGKTSLCQALAHKLAIRLNDQYQYGQLFEVNSHSLFSKWFSESGNLVQRMFETIRSIADDPTVLVCVMIDEVESLAATRKAGGNEPTDALRVVNALLTQIDQIKRLPNVLILTTSNVSGAIDLAFVDRADFKKYIGPPSTRALYQILLSSVEELMRVRILQSHPLLSLNALENTNLSLPSDSNCLSYALFKAAQKANGLSGRILKKLPLLALIKMTPTSDGASLSEFIECLTQVVDEEISDRNALRSGNGPPGTLNNPDKTTY
ncbi:hypothetical protein TCAL_03656 [Tigriopus californicus]|uniref:AAA+ ATPase domain-containing protein n=1 Tax=Tigriopus californicus TaxID=6832 RepID=A0A553NDW2_TIGCA|nr:pachytene checkpoint protein 2 homolog [Tigriopus californicus]TRY63539.1 hypothetical protein TCAL_03656 [Tigriopus californicus]|eukprot:TCALIF_03656-PA protein Name:"Similar to TRIP13 Pachytene checkpoint protein 2 homolog (Gallus gallus)" AED:0.03 eAED:0.03 QI:223/1/1/1/1/1/2/133/484